MPRPKTIEINDLTAASARSSFKRLETPYKLRNHQVGWRKHVANLAWWALRKIKALDAHMETITTWTYEPSSQDRLHHKMVEAMNADLPGIIQDDYVFVIGMSEFKELTHSPDFVGITTFETGPFGINDPRFGRRIFDIPIHVVPNLKGFAMLPKAIVVEVREPE